MRRRPAPATLPVSRLPFLEALRGIAALYVVIGHICTLADPARILGHDDHAPAWLQSVMRPFQFGHLAVASFIVLSGFCLQLSMFSRQGGTVGHLGKFYRRRALRILPAYYACLAISIWVCFNVTAKHPELSRFLPVTQVNIVAHIFLYHNYSLAWMYKINGVLWSIAIEAQLYVVFPLLVLCFVKFGRWNAFLLTVILAMAAMQWVPHATKLYPWFLPMFVSGMGSAHLAYRPHLRYGIKPALGWIVTVGALASVAYFVTNGDLLAPGDASMGLGTAAICYAFTTSQQGWAINLISRPLFVRLGNISYSLYLVHHPMLQIIYDRRPVSSQDELSIFLHLMCFGLPIVILGAWVFYHVFELPFMPRRTASVVEARPGLFPFTLPLRPYATEEPPSVLNFAGDPMPMTGMEPTARTPVNDAS
jgi:peptidoglycan/LPS O-acetylase OafA/YrhL